MYYSEAIPDAVVEKDRLVKARQIYAVIKKHCAGRNTREMILLDYGSSTGIMTSYFTSKFKRVIGVDVDRPAISIATARFKSTNVTFLAISNEQTMFKNDCFDVVVANQVYNYVRSQTDMFAEIYRILKPGGVCFLGARNKYALVEAQYKLPLLSILPAGLAKAYLRLFRRTSNFVGDKYLSHSAIRKLAMQFRVHDYTVDILKHPKEYEFDSLTKYSAVANVLPLKYVYQLLPNYIMILEKR